MNAQEHACAPRAYPDPTADDVLLSVQDLRTHFFTRAGVVKAVDGVSFESAAGRDAGHRRRVRLRQERHRPLDHAPDRPRPAGSWAAGSSSTGATCWASTTRELRRLRGTVIGMIFQDPMTALNPVFTIGYQIAETLKLHQRHERPPGGGRARRSCWSGWASRRRASG